MSTVAERAAALPLLPDDPFYFGFRTVRRELPDGSTRSEQMPLSLADHLHPGEGDHFMEGSLHSLWVAFLATIFRSRVGRDPAALLLSNTGVYWDDLLLGWHAPDVALILGIRQPRVNWPSFHVATEGVRPRLIIEVVSPRFRTNDVVDKLRDYHLARVPLYVILDREHDDDPWTIRAYQRNPRRYQPLPLDDDGRLWLEDVNLWLAVDGQRIRCFDGDTDQEIGDYETLTRRLEAEKSQVVAANARAAAAEARIRELEAENARLKG